MCIRDRSWNGDVAASVGLQARVLASLSGAVRVRIRRLRASASPAAIGVRTGSAGRVSNDAGESAADAANPLTGVGAAGRPDSPPTAPSQSQMPAKSLVPAPLIGRFAGAVRAFPPRTVWRGIPRV